MRSTWMTALLLIALIMVTIPIGEVEGREVSLEDDEYYVSVNPEDDNRCLLEINGEIDPGDIGRLDTVTVSLSVVIHELVEGETTGRTWFAEVSYDNSAIAGSSNVFRRGDNPESFTISTDPEAWDSSRHDSIPLPEGLSTTTEGRVVLTASFSGGQNGEEIVQASIYPEQYHLINLTTWVKPVELEAGNKLSYSLSLKNAGNMIDSINLEVPILDQLENLDFTTDLVFDHFDDVQPGETVMTNLTIKAPLEIKRNDSMDLIITAYTDSEDPVTLEPASSRTLVIDLKLIRSKIDQPQPSDDDDDTDDDDDDKPYVPKPGEDPMLVDDEAEPWMVVVAIGFIALILLIIIIVLFKRGGGGDEGEDEIDQVHSSMVRI